MPTADLELSIQPDGDVYVAAARLTPPDGKVTATLARDVPVRLDRAALLAAALDADEYGRRLTAMIFADQRLRETWREARGFAHGAQTALRLRIRLDPAADASSAGGAASSITPPIRALSVRANKPLRSPQSRLGQTFAIAAD